MDDIRMLPIARIFQRRNSRPRSSAALDALSESIDAVGLLAPITVRSRDSGYEVLAGAHRLQACELLGHTEISCVVLDVDDLRAELAAIDENLIRTELSPSERAMQTARRKAIYETLHPQTKAFVAGAHGSNAAQGKFVANVATASFADDLADRTGIAARSIRRDAERGGRIVGPALTRLSGTRLDTGRFLDELKRIGSATTDRRSASPSTGLMAADWPASSRRPVSALPTSIDDAARRT
jgi:ParB-like chromosome segregation protein Spo0J